ncbi:hypothetical protein CYLTODRAFT_490204 [Cylindrobasidium torrendii FP15055 ss-10]|uniref:Uncharacterized protein n=1 Tax=Cylindrobasidium torrendii FP15055 ss-10 TaxID=1314674 RepID=A0A0D7BBR5_9AGAR|nr:hypothetical protein CYLTODRAFT_490204 [Cylindrobasidium torrendii FP15055 ss-10]
MSSRGSPHSATGSSSTARPPNAELPQYPSPPASSSRMPVTPALIRGIFASSRSPNEERSISRIAFFRFTGFVLSAMFISWLAARGRGVRGSAALLGGVVLNPALRLIVTAIPLSTTSILE